MKLGYNKLGYNELQVKTNRFFQFFQSQIQAYFIIQPGYNESWLNWKNLADPKHVCYNWVSLYSKFYIIFFFKFVFLILVMLIGGNSSNEGNVMTFNSRTGASSQICDIGWGIEEVFQWSFFQIILSIFKC